MMFSWKSKKGGARKTRDQILQAMDASPILFPWEMERGGIAPSECKETAKMLGLRWSGNGDFSRGLLVEMLKTYGPLWVAGKWQRNSSHVIVVTACDPDTGVIKYNDPMEPSGMECTGGVDWLNNRGRIWKECDASVMYWK